MSISSYEKGENMSAGSCEWCHMSATLLLIPFSHITLGSLTLAVTKKVVHLFFLLLFVLVFFLFFLLFFLN